MSDDGWGDDDGWTDGAGDAAAAPAAGDEAEEVEEEKPRGGGGDGKCRNCRQEGHFASDCPEPEVCRKCKKEGHKAADCSLPDKCRNCNEEGHLANECPREPICKRCKEEGHMVADCPKPMICNRCKKENHMAKDCTEEEQTRTYVDAEGVEKEVYIPAPDAPVEELFKLGISTGINFDSYQNIPVKQTGENKVAEIKSFEQANLRPLLMENITKSGYKTPTPIQKNGIPIILGGHDMMGCAQTGSGKTAAFLIPIVNSLIASNADSNSGSKAAPQALIVTPTRELANQIYSEARKFCAGSMLKCRVAFGGTSTGFQNSRLMQGCNILVSTTGRLLDFVEKGFISFENLKFLVLDEADRMLDQGFMPDVEKITENDNCPKKEDRQTLMFSATFSDEVQEAAKAFLKDEYLFVTVGLVGGVCKDVRQEFLEVEQFNKRDKLEEVLNAPDRNPVDRALVFVQTKKNADFVTANLCQNGFEAVSIHGDRFLSQRFEALENFKSGTKPVLVATAVAARGLDINGVELVINYDLPREIEEYVHRIGRTGRVGNPGRAISFVDAAENADVVKKIVSICAECQVEVPDFLVTVAESAGDDAASTNGAANGGDDDDEWG